jgi:hypothetical protein
MRRAISNDQTLDFGPRDFSTETVVLSANLAIASRLSAPLSAAFGALVSAPD